MANDLETMRARLRDQLADADDETWHAGEKDDILHWSVRRLNQRLPRPLDPEAAAQKITLVAADYYYAIDTGITAVNAVDYVDSSGSERGYLTTGWEVVGDLGTGLGKLHVSPTIVENGGYLRIYGSGRYILPSQTATVQTQNIPDDYVPLVLAWARAECYRRLTSDRARFRQWQVANQVANISVNELVQMVNDADRQAEDEYVIMRRWQKPVIGRIG